MQAIVWAYKRPELTKKIVSKLQHINSELERECGTGGVSQIRLIHDGIRDDEDYESRQSHERTRELCLDLERNNAGISTLFFPDNIGLTNHLFRTVNCLDSNLENFIFFEEDKAPTLEGIKYLVRESKYKLSFNLLDTLPLNKHTCRQNDRIHTLFTDNGNLIIDNEIYSLVKHLWTVKDRYQECFQRNLFFYLSSFLSGYSLKRAFRYYSAYYSWGLNNNDRPDSLFSYALILSKRFKVCPTAPLSINWSDQDTRGKSVNIVPNNRGNECKSSTFEIWGYELCLQCEKQGVSERVALNPATALRKGLQFRFQKYFANKESN